MIEAILLICAFLTLASVCSAAFMCFVCGVLFYKQSKMIDAQIDGLPAKIQAVVSKMVAVYAKPCKEFFDEQGESGVAPIPSADYLNETSEDDLKWLSE